MNFITLLYHTTYTKTSKFLAVYLNILSLLFFILPPSLLLFLSKPPWLELFKLITSNLQPPTTHHYRNPAIIKSKQPPRRPKSIQNQITTTTTTAETQPKSNHNNHHHFQNSAKIKLQQRPTRIEPRIKTHIIETHQTHSERKETH